MSMIDLLLSDFETILIFDKRQMDQLYYQIIIDITDFDCMSDASVLFFMSIFDLTLSDF